MKRFIIKTIIYLVLITFFAICIDIIISFGLKQVDDFIYKPWKEIGNGGMNNDIVILGNSRAQGHIHPFYLDSVCACNSYNLGIEAYSMNMHILKYNYYLLHNIKPRLILYQIDLATIHSGTLKHGSNSEQFLPLFYEPFWRKNFENLGYNKFDLYLPLYRYFGYHKAIRQGIIEGLHLYHITENPNYKGFKGWNERWNGNNWKDANGKLLMDNDNRFTTETDDLYRFEEFIIECIDQNINIVLIYSPIYQEAEKLLTDRDVFKHYINYIAEKYKIIYLDYNNGKYTMCSEIEYFSSAGHLNLKGAEIFTKQLAHDLDSLHIIKH